MAGLKKLSSHVRKAVEEEGSERKIALSFAVGVFISFTPLLSIHTIMAIGIAILFRFNKVAIIAGAWVNNHFTIPFVFYFSYKIGAVVVGADTAPPSFESLSYRVLLDYFKVYGVPLFVGTTITGLIGAVISYYFMYYTVLSFRKRAMRKGGPGEGIKV